MEHKILKTFKGSQDGRFTELFEAKTTRDLSESLAAIAVKEGWAKPVETKKPKETAPSSEEKRQALGVEIAGLEEQIAAAAAADKPGLEAELLAKRDELAQLA